MPPQIRHEDLRCEEYLTLVYKLHLLHEPLNPLLVQMFDLEQLESLTDMIILRMYFIGL